MAFKWMRTRIEKGRGGRRRPEPARGAQAPPLLGAMVRSLAERTGARRVVGVGLGDATGVVADIAVCPVLLVEGFTDHPDEAGVPADAEVLEADLEAGLPGPAREDAEGCIIIFRAVAGRLADPGPLLRDLADLARRAPLVIGFALSERSTEGRVVGGDPASMSSLLGNLSESLRAEGFPQSMLTGFTVDAGEVSSKSTPVVLAGRYVDVDSCLRAPRAAAVMPVFNEIDILPETLDHLTRQGLDVHVVDNWSSDGSYEMVEKLAAADPRVTVERFPHQASRDFELARLLDHAAKWAAHAGYKWVVSQGADELRYSPWPDVTLAEAIAFVDALGFNAVDFTVVDFRFLRADPDPQPPFERSLRHFQFGNRPGHFAQVNAWRQPPGVEVDLVSSGGHLVGMPGLRVFPLKFLLKHYPLRTREQATRKVFADRLPRMARERAERGWHIQYDQFRGRTIDGWDPSNLILWEDDTFHAEFLVERLSGIGIVRDRADSEAEP